MQHTHLFAATPTIRVLPALPLRFRYLQSVTDDGLQYNLKTCIPERLANEMGH